MTQFDLDIRNFAFGGESYGVLPSGKGCFVRGAAPGENVTVEIVSEHARFFRARLLKVNQSSPERIEPVCPLAGQCPGCSFNHITYREEIRCKQEIFERFLQGTRCVDPAVIQKPTASPERLNWRNKIRLAVENGLCGYRGIDNVSLIPLRNCPLVHKEINDFLQNLSLGTESTIELRYTPAAGVIQLTSGNREQIIFDTLPGFGDFPVPAGAFFQTNPQVASLLVEEVIRQIRATGIKTLTELHCGAGMFSLCAAMKIQGLTTTGAEITAASIACAQRAAKLFKLNDRCSFFSSDAAKFYRKQKKCRLLLVDPPRSGLDKKLMENILRNPPEHLLYVSCGPDTLQRDIRKLCSAGAKVISAQLFDMFPCTAHFESLTHLVF